MSDNHQTWFHDLMTDAPRGHAWARAFSQTVIRVLNLSEDLSDEESEEFLKAAMFLNLETYLISCLRALDNNGIDREQFKEIISEEQQAYKIVAQEYLHRLHRLKSPDELGPELKPYNEIDPSPN